MCFCNSLRPKYAAPLVEQAYIHIDTLVIFSCKRVNPEEALTPLASKVALNTETTTTHGSTTTTTVVYWAEGIIVLYFIRGHIFQA
jgi:hypothetical protein